MKPDYIILMADIIKSRERDQSQLMEDFDHIVKVINHDHENALLSPLTITLGDEFQSIIGNLTQAVEIIFRIEELIISRGDTFKLRYVIVEGQIDTPINHLIAYGMMGEGLARARQFIQNLKKSEYRFYFNLRNQTKAKALNNLFIAMQETIDNWVSGRDYSLIASFLLYKDYKAVAEKLEKDRSLMWKRQKSLKIDTYIALKELALYIGGNTNA